MPLHPDWLVPQWPAPAHVHAVCSTRTGGTSGAPYDTLNLGDHVGDAPAQVGANRIIFAQAIGAKPVFLSQVHGVDCVTLSPNTAQGSVADACISTQSGIACTIMVADCLPVLLTDLNGSVVGAAHAGWRSLAGVNGRGVLEVILERFKALRPADTSALAPKIIAWLGPCIGPQAFEVGPEVRAAFVMHDPAAAALFTPHTPGKWWADLQGLARLRLAALGVQAIFGNDGSADWCSVSQPSRLFSHRRDGVSGRMAACIWLD